MMRPTNSHPDRWLPATLILHRDGDTLAGTLTLGDVAWHVRRWTRLPDGSVTCEAQAVSDAWFDGFEAEQIEKART